MMNMHMLRFLSWLSILLILSITTPNVAGADRPTILIFGDSLSAGHGIELSQGWVKLLAQRLAQHGYRHRVINASISGDTSRGGLVRLPAALERYHPDIVILELGGNDGLRGLSLRTLETNLATMIELAQQAGAQVLLAEMRIPPNYGPRYTQKFQAIYRNLAEHYDGGGRARRTPAFPRSLPPPRARARGAAGSPRSPRGARTLAATSTAACRRP
jgi:acyl-CoA thioesterase-1